MKKRKKSAKSSARKTTAAKKPAPRRAVSYTPKPLQGDGWAPFRYPLQ